MAQRVDRGIALLFHDRGTRRWVSGQQHALAALYPQERPGIHFTGGWVGPQDRSEQAENLVLIGIRSSNYPARSQSLYRLELPGPQDLIEDSLKGGYQTLSIPRNIILTWYIRGTLIADGKHQTSHNQQPF